MTGATARTHKCPACSKAFATKGSLRQHRAAAHQQGATRKAARQKRPTTSASVSAPSNVPAQPGATVRLKGSELLKNFRVDPRYPSPVDLLLSANCVPRLAHMAAAFQRIRFHAATMVITPQASTMVNGGYVAAFVADPTDVVTDAARLQSQQGAVVRKWWESASVRLHTNIGEKLFTSLVDDNLRWYSPGKFHLEVTAWPTSTVDVNVTLQWDVTLEGPSLEKDAPLAKRVAYVERSLWGVKGNYAFGDSMGNMDKIPDMVSGLPERAGLYWYRVPTYIVEYSEGSGDTGSRQHQFVVYDARERRLYFADEPGSVPDKTEWQSNLTAQILIPASTEMILSRAGNLTASRRNLQPSGSLISSGNDCEATCELPSTTSAASQITCVTSEMISELNSTMSKLALALSKVELAPEQAKSE